MGFTSRMGGFGLDLCSSRYPVVGCWKHSNELSSSLGEGFLDQPSDLWGNRGRTMLHGVWTGSASKGFSVGSADFHLFSFSTWRTVCCQAENRHCRTSKMLVLQGHCIQSVACLDHVQFLRTERRKSTVNVARNFQAQWDRAWPSFGGKNVAR